MYKNSIQPRRLYDRQTKPLNNAGAADKKRSRLYIGYAGVFLICDMIFHYRKHYGNGAKLRGIYLLSTHQIGGFILGIRVPRAPKDFLIILVFYDE